MSTFTLILSVHFTTNAYVAYFYLSKGLNAGLLLAVEYFHSVAYSYLSKGSEYFFHHCYIVKV